MDTEVIGKIAQKKRKYRKAIKLNTKGVLSDKSEWVAISSTWFPSVTVAGSCGHCQSWSLSIMVTVTRGHYQSWSLSIVVTVSRGHYQSWSLLIVVTVNHIVLVIVTVNRVVLVTYPNQPMVKVSN